MKLTKTELKKMIREAVREQLNEQSMASGNVVDAINQLVIAGLDLGSGSYFGGDDPKQLVDKAVGNLPIPNDDKAKLADVVASLMKVGMGSD